MTFIRTQLFVSQKTHITLFTTQYSQIHRALQSVVVVVISEGHSVPPVLHFIPASIHVSLTDAVLRPRFTFKMTT